MSLQAGSVFRREALPQTPLFSTYLRTPAWAEALSLVNFGTFSLAAKVTSTGTPPTTVLWTGKPNTAMGSAAMRTVKEERSISDQMVEEATTVRRHKLPLILYEKRGHVVLDDIASSSGAGEKSLILEVDGGGSHVYSRGDPDRSVKVPLSDKYSYMVTA